MKPLPFFLSLAENSELLRIVKYGENWRIRERAETILSLAKGISCSKAAHEIGLSRATVETTRKTWLRDIFDSLPDLPRSGAPRKIKQEEASRILALANESPMSAPDLLKIHIENNGKEVHVATIHALLKREGLTWKRTRHSLKKIDA